jgi:hypothetical protein
MNDCFFDPATALCLNGKTETATPTMAQCRPDRFPNSCIASHHRPLWAKAIADGEELLSCRHRYRKVLRQRLEPE